MIYLFLLVGLIWGFDLQYDSPPLCNYTSSVPRESKLTTLQIGDKVFVCIFLSTGLSSIASMAFKIPVDTYAMLQMTNSHAVAGTPSSSGPENAYYVWASAARHSAPFDITGDAKSIVHTFANSQASNPSAAWPASCDSATTLPISNTTYPTISALSSCPFIYADEEYTATLLSLVINMESGVIVSIVWDNDCFTCASNSPECLKGYGSLVLQEQTAQLDYLIPDTTSELKLDGSCGTLHTECKAVSTSASSCDLKVLVTWSGTDKFGRQLSTAGIRLSQFAGMSLSSLWDSVVYSFVPPTTDNNDSIIVNLHELENPDEIVPIN